MRLATSEQLRERAQKNVLEKSSCQKNAAASDAIVMTVNLHRALRYRDYLRRVPILKDVDVTGHRDGKCDTER
jgi:hypothetical protein